MAGRPKGPDKKQVIAQVLAQTRDQLEADMRIKGLNIGQVIDRWAEDRRAEQQRQAS